MANICSFEMVVRGKRKQINAFVNALNQKGSIFIGRGAECSLEPYETDGDWQRDIITGWCKWSIQSSLIDDAISMRKNPEKWYWGESSPEAIITIKEASHIWNLEIEAFSEEPGIGFMEHFVFSFGDLILHECVDYVEYYLGDYKSKEEAESELDIEITDKEWSSEEYISRGGLPWEYDFV